MKPSCAKCGVLTKLVTKLLVSEKMRIAVAESCTGGLLSSCLVDVPGVARVFDRGIVTYSNRSKIECLGVKEDTLRQNGAVSEQVAIQMAVGAKRISSADIGLAITGIAGPGGGTSEKPVGLVYIAISGPEMTKCNKMRFRGSRWQIRVEALLASLEMLYGYLRERSSHSEV